MQRRTFIQALLGGAFAAAASWYVPGLMAEVPTPWEPVAEDSGWQKESFVLRSPKPEDEIVLSVAPGLAVDIDWYRVAYDKDCECHHQFRLQDDGSFVAWFGEVSGSDFPSWIQLDIRFRSIEREERWIAIGRERFEWNPQAVNEKCST